MEISDLAIFAKVAEVESITKAAEQLFRVPSNITARVKKLENELQKELFIREKNRLRISPAGEQLLEYARKILALAAEAREQLHQASPSGILRIGSMEAVAASRLSPVLTRFHQSFTEVTLEVSTGPTGELIEQVLEAKLDMALVADPPADERLGMLPVFGETLVIVSSIAHPDIRTVDDLGESPTMLGFGAKCAYRERLTRWIVSADRVVRVVEINSYHALLNCVIAGMGVGLVPEKLLETYPFVDGLKVHRLPQDWGRTVTHLIWRKDADRPSMSAFRGEIEKYKVL